MALEDKVKETAVAQDGTALTDDEEQDLKIAVLFAQKLIDEGGSDIITQAVKESKDPGQVIGQFLMQMVSQLHEKLPEDMQLSKRIYFAEGGWIEQVSDYIQEEYDVSKKIMDRAEMYIGGAAKQMAQGQAQQATQGQPPQGAAPGPEQAPMPQAGGV
jgi:hypothetical protein